MLSYNLMGGYMEFNYKQLLEKVLLYWRNHDGEAFTSKELKETFSIYELGAIMCNYSFLKAYCDIVYSFSIKLQQIEDLFTSSEAEEIFDIVENPTYIYKYLSDNKLLSLISEDDYNKTFLVARNLSSDEAKIKGFNKVENSFFKAAFICSFSSDELKLQYLKKVNSVDRIIIVSSFKDSSLKEKYINSFMINKGVIIKTLSSDEKKTFYFKKYFKALSDKDKISIIASLKEENKIIELLTLCSDNVKKKTVYYLNSKGILTNNLIEKIIKIMNIKIEIYNILKCDFISDELVFKYLYKLNDNRKIKLIDNMKDSNLKFKAYKFLRKKELMFESIEHSEIFPEYSDEYKFIINIYAKKYNVNLENLICLAFNVSLNILKVIKNENIINILNSSSEEFMKIVQLFSKENLKMTSSSMNDILNALLQRKFRIQHSDIILVFTDMLNAIKIFDRNFLLEKINMMYKFIDIDKLISKEGLSKEQFINLLLFKDEKALLLLHEIAAKFILEKRNIYIKENLEICKRQCTIDKISVSNLTNYIMTSFPVELIITLILRELNTNYLTEFECEFIKNKDLKELVLNKKNNNNYKINVNDMKIFNKIFDKIAVKFYSQNSIDINTQKKSFEFKNLDMDFLVNVMTNLDINKMRKYLLSDSYDFDKLLNFINQYKLIGWGKIFDFLLSQTDIVANEETVANFIQNFGLFYKCLENKKNNGQLANISITALLDLASCYNFESNKYALVLGFENFKYIVSNPGPNAATLPKEKRLKEIDKLLKIIRNRKFVTVPTIDKTFCLKNNKKINIVVGNFSNIINLTYGERTGSCMRIGGPGESLFRFCLNDENGFHIRFSNPNGKLISKVSGYRNGNTVFLNGLRYSEDPNYTNKDLIQACKAVSDELIKLSKDSFVPIDNVIISNEYSMKESDMLVKNLNISNSQSGMQSFYTDIKSNSIVLSSSNNDELVPIKLGIKSLPKYFVKRDKQKLLYGVECQEYIIHLKSLDQVLSGSKIDSITVKDEKNILFGIVGEDWVVAITKDGFLNEYIMNNSNDKEQAKKEMKSALIYLKENYNKINIKDVNVHIKKLI